MKEFINIALRIENKTKTGDIIPHKSHQFVWVLNGFFIILFFYCDEWLFFPIFQIIFYRIEELPP